jgi:ribonuclease HI
MAGFVLGIVGALQIKRIPQYLELDVSSNKAEYRALIMGLKMALQYRVDRLEICGDSERVIRQVKHFKVDS